MITLKQNLNQTELKERLSYNSETGEFIWRFRAEASKSWNSKYSGKSAGTLDYQGYYRISINNQIYRAHRLVFLYITGNWPTELVDHINGKPSDNRWCNLRLVNHIQNRTNHSVRSNNSSGATGVTQNKKNGKWIASIKGRSLGVFKDFESALQVRKDAENKMYGIYIREANHG